MLTPSPYTVPSGFATFTLNASIVYAFLVENDALVFSVLENGKDVNVRVPMIHVAHRVRQDTIARLGQGAEH